MNTVKILNDFVDVVEGKLAQIDPHAQVLRGKNSAEFHASPALPGMLTDAICINSSDDGVIYITPEDNYIPVQEAQKSYQISGNDDLTRVFGVITQNLKELTGLDIEPEYVVANMHITHHNNF